MRERGREEGREEAEDGGVFPPFTLDPADLITAATAAENVAVVIGKDDEDNAHDPAADTDVEIDAELSLDDDSPPDTIAAALPDARLAFPKPVGFRDGAASRPVRGNPMGEGEYKPTGDRRWELPEGREEEAAAIMLALSFFASSLCALQRSAVTLVPRLAAMCIEDDACNDDDDRDGPEDDEDEGGDDGGNDNDDEREEEEEEEELEEEDE